MTTPHDEVAAANRAYRDALEVLNEIDPAAYQAIASITKDRSMGMAYLATQASLQYGDRVSVEPGDGVVEVDMTKLITRGFGGPIRCRWEFGITADVNPRWQAVDLEDVYFEPPTWQTFKDAFRWAVANTGPRK